MFCKEFDFEILTRQDGMLFAGYSDRSSKIIRVDTESVLRTYIEKLIKTVIKQEMPVEELYKILCENEWRLKCIYDEYGTDAGDLTEDMMDEDDYIFTRISCNEKSIPISFRQLVCVYDQVVRPVLDKKLDSVIAYMMSCGAGCFDSSNDAFRIMLVGKLGGFYLVRRQLLDRFRFNSMDKRAVTALCGSSEALLSRDLGLFADESIRVIGIAEFSLGVCNGSGMTLGQGYALYKNHEIEYDKVYFQRDEHGELVVFMPLSGGIDSFAINTGCDGGNVRIVAPKPKYRKLIRGTMADRADTVVVGISVDVYGVLSLHIYDYDLMNDTVSNDGTKIELACFNELFGEEL